ncbi:MAG TPA: PQQ-binding-like beta-propeller repeat protein, partial [Streptosporangiaceae bacterium]|nr:PQQ-binding-like beta-propeller repeat protein [Streptosporangiaceae bacterium]
MRTRSRQSLMAATTALALAGLTAGGPSPAANAAGSQRSAVSRSPLWADRFVQGGSPAAATANANEVFVTGSSASRPNGPAYATEAYSASTGARLWSARYKIPGTSLDFAHAIAASPDGSAVFVAGSGYGTVAYDAATGERLWATRFSEPGKGYENADS